MFEHEKIESYVSSFWEENEIYRKLKQRLSKEKKFFFVDGPPYATGEIHPGTAWNKTMKDSIIRYFRAKGYNVRDQPGFDTHGLPIEVKVEKLLSIKQKKDIEEKVGLERFVEECKKFADKYIAIMTKQFKSLAVWMDWDNPYITYKDRYIENSWKVIKKAWDKGLLHEGDYVTPYCFRCETTMANYELEYKDRTDPSIYIKFADLEKKDYYYIVWTTTPWTLVGNMAIMVNPEVDYVEVEVEGETWVVAKELLDALFSRIGKSYSIKSVFKGKELEGRRYHHPFQDLISKEYPRRIVLSQEFVSVEEGTGLVHTAPGHGPEDFKVGKLYNIEIFSPVDEKGRYKEEAGKFKGMNVLEANEEIIRILEDRGLLVHKEIITHRYPHCWRCKTPLIYISTHQWFLSIHNVKQKMLDEIEKVNFIPEFMKKRFYQFVEGAPDWCISRQRYWGIPLPIWKCKNGHVRVISSREELERYGKVKELHRPYIDEIKLTCVECGEEMERVKDVLDVWFDSSNAVWAPLNEEERKEWGDKADFILEGHDQIRGWFYSLLGSGVVYISSSPYRAVLVHGFFLDEKGEKMSKSVGNFIPIEEIIAKYGVDAFRLWGLSNTTWEDVKFSWEELRIANKELNILLNLAEYLKRAKAIKYSNVELEVEDKWLLEKLEDLLFHFNNAFLSYRPFEGVKLLRKFLVEELSQFYMKRAKQRISNKENERAALHTLYVVMFELTKLFSIITPYTAEYIYQNYFRAFEKEESIFFHSLGEGKEKKKDEMKLAKKLISSALKLREKAGIKLRWPVKEVVVLSNKEVLEELKPLTRFISSMVNAKTLTLSTSFEEKEGYISDSLEEGVKVILNTFRDESLIKEGLLNEILRRIQFLRKKARLVEEDRIVVYYSSPSLESLIEENKQDIAKKVNAVDIKKSEDKEGFSSWDIEGNKLWLKIEKVKQ